MSDKGVFRTAPAKPGLLTIWYYMVHGTWYYIFTVIWNPNIMFHDLGGK